MLTRKPNLFMRWALAGALSFSALGVASCGTEGPETGADVEDVQEAPEETETNNTANPFDGPYDQDFLDDVDVREGQEVTVSANVNEIITPEAFTIAGTEDTTVDPLLVLHKNAEPELKPELTVKVTGTVHTAFDLPAVEKDLDVDLDDALFEDWDGKPYLKASEIDTSVAADD
ncbi:hypothetical protein [Arthrobacter sp. B6]|uniref:hypothetical protein n=1 Tax=Arthrobacter sp. B6 TaxID=1570137 RepID=UPI000AD63CD5|nr:hypothetical protein [Arthrobacter sp. B6]